MTSSTRASLRTMYRKWFGLHWRLVSLADFELPVDRADVRERLDTESGRRTGH
jgi:hypothetical protein